MKPTLTATLAGLALALSVTPLPAHHSVASTFDISKEIAIRGVVTRTEWMNPHARFWMDVKNDDGTISNWELELPPPNALKREGKNRDFIQQGDAVNVMIWRAKDGSALGNP